MMMKHMVQRSLSFVALVGALSCTGDPTGDLRKGIDHLRADPSALFVGQDSTKFVTVEAVDDQGNQIATKFSVGAVGAGITAVKDLTFNPIFDNKGNETQPSEVTRAQFIVTATASTANSSFQVNAGGKSITIPVRIVPVATSLPTTTLSSAAPAAGDTVVITAPPPYKFSSTSAGSVGVNALFKVGVSADSSQLRVVAPPALNGTISVTNVVLGYAPTVSAFTLTSGVALVTPALPSLALNRTTASAGDMIIVTAPAPYRFTGGASGSVPSVGTAGLALVGVSTDSTQLSFLIGPSANAAVSVTKLLISGAATLGPFTLTSGATSLTTPAITNFPAALSNAAPAIQDTITLTITSGFKFLPTATVSTGANGFIVARGADSSFIRFVPIPGTTTGPPSVTGVVLSNLTNVPLTLPASVSLTVPAAYAGAVAIATAPTINIPATGATTMYLDNGPTAAAAACGAIGNHCRFYRIVLAAPRTFRATLNWGNTADIGGYFIDAAGTDQFGNFACDNFGSGPTAQPEICSQTLPAGTFYLALADFTAAAQNTNYRITLLGQ
jgi:hypothetical protein